MVTQSIKSSDITGHTSSPESKNVSESVCATENKSLPIVKKKAKGQKPRARKHHCTECGKSFDKIYNLKRHQKIHTNEKDFMCGVCGKSFIQKDYMRIHMKTHDKNPSELCKICGQKFKLKRCLDIHMLIHNNEWPYVCTICNSKHRQSSDLQTHMRSHTNERPYSCKLCRKAFKRSHALTVHLRVHTQEKPYECKYCSERFNQSNNLKTHMKMVHKGLQRSAGSWSIKLIKKKSMRKTTRSTKKEGKLKALKNVRAHDETLSKYASSRQIPYSVEKPWKQQVPKLSSCTHETRKARKKENNTGNGCDANRPKKNSRKNPDTVKSACSEDPATLYTTKDVKSEPVEENFETDLATGNSDTNTDYDNDYICNELNFCDMLEVDSPKIQKGKKTPNETADGDMNSQTEKLSPIANQSEKFEMNVSDKSFANSCKSKHPRRKQNEKKTRTSRQKSRMNECEKNNSRNKDSRRMKQKKSTSDNETSRVESNAQTEKSVPKNLKRKVSKVKPSSNGLCARHIPYARTVDATCEFGVFSPDDECSSVLISKHAVNIEHPISRSVVFGCEENTVRTSVDKQIPEDFKVMEHMAHYNNSTNKFSAVNTILSQEEYDILQKGGRLADSVQPDIKPPSLYSSQISNSQKQDSDLSGSEMVIVHVYVNRTSPYTNNNNELLRPTAFNDDCISGDAGHALTNAGSPQLGMGTARSEEGNKLVCSVDLMNSSTCTAKQMVQAEPSDQTRDSSHLQYSDQQNFREQKTLTIKTEVTNSSSVLDSIKLSRNLDRGPGAVNKLFIGQPVNTDFCSSPPKKRFKMSYLNSGNI